MNLPGHVRFSPFKIHQHLDLPFRTFCTFFKKFNGCVLWQTASEMFIEHINISFTTVSPVPTEFWYTVNPQQILAKWMTE